MRRVACSEGRLRVSPQVKGERRSLTRLLIMTERVVNPQATWNPLFSLGISCISAVLLMRSFPAQIDSYPQAPSECLRAILLSDSRHVGSEVSSLGWIHWKVPISNSIRVKSEHGSCHQHFSYSFSGYFLYHELYKLFKAHLLIIVFYNNVTEPQTVSKTSLQYQLVVNVIWSIWSWFHH